MILMRRYISIFIFSVFVLHAFAQEYKDQLLTGTPIGSPAVDYNTGSISTTVNQPSNAFDGDYSTFYASYARSNTWVGLDLGTPHIITGVGWGPRDTWASRVQLAVFEGANKEDFSDAIPLYIVPNEGEYNTLSTAPVTCSRGFRYVRYVGPNDARCNVSEVAFYGIEGAGSDSLFSQLTNLPTLVVNIENGEEIDSRSIDRVAHVSLISENGLDILETDSTLVRGRGNGSWTFPKKPFRMKFAKKHRMPGAPAKDKKWTVINNYGDKTLMRNMLAFEVSRLFGRSYTPYCQPVDVVVNGEYRGQYQLSDKIEVGKNRIELNETDTLTGERAFLIEIDAYASEESLMFNSNKGTPVTIHFPDYDDTDEFTTAERTQGISKIKSVFNTFETAAYSTSFSSETSGYRKYFDVTSLLTYLLVNEFSGNTDTFWSTYIYKNPGEKMYVGPVWDVDLGFENDDRTYSVNNLSEFIYRNKGSVASSSTRNLINRIVFSDTKSWPEMRTLWTLARVKNGLTADHFDTLVDSLRTYLYASQQLNFVRWPIMNSYVHQNPICHGSYDAEVDAVKEYIHDRLEWMDNYVGLDEEIITQVEDIPEDYTFCYPEPGGIRTAVTLYAPVQVFTPNGLCIATTSDPSTYLPLQPGLYILRSGTQSIKVRVQ